MIRSPAVLVLLLGLLAVGAAGCPGDNTDRTPAPGDPVSCYDETGNPVDCAGSEIDVDVHLPPGQRPSARTPRPAVTPPRNPPQQKAPAPPANRVPAAPPRR